MIYYHYFLFVVILFEKMVEVTGTATISAFEQTTKNPFVDLTCEKHERKANRIVFSIPVVPFASTVTISFTVVYSNY